MLTSISESAREAHVRYFDGHSKTLISGAYVTCAATDRKIPLDALRYWSVDRQEAYFDAAAAKLRRRQLATEDT
jgi:hypothetical protein